MNKKKVKRDIVDVKIRDIEKNPFRDFSTYALQEDKIASLMESIRETGFWENVVGRRRADRKVEIAYGHHRLEAAKRVFKPDDTIPIIIKPLTDDKMRKMMIRENKAEYGCLPAAIDDAVKAARDYLEGHREEAEKLLKTGRPDVKRVRVGAPVIVKYTGYSQSTVEASLRRLEWIDSGKVDKEALYLMPNTAAALRFADAVMQHPASQPHQKTLAAYIVKKGGFGRASIELAFREFVPVGKVTDPAYPRYCERKLIEATHLIKKAATALYDLNQLNQVTFTTSATKEDISGPAIQNYSLALDALSRAVEAVGALLDREPLKPLIPEQEEAM